MTERHSNDVVCREKSTELGVVDRSVESPAEIRLSSFDKDAKNLVVSKYCVAERLTMVDSERRELSGLCSHLKRRPVRSFGKERSTEPTPCFFSSL